MLWSLLDLSRATVTLDGYADTLRPSYGPSRWREYV